MSTDSKDVNDIRREMARVRRELHSDVQGVVSTAEAATDWRHYLTLYPWLSFGIATTIGYLIVPTRHVPAMAASGTATEVDLAKIREAVAQTQKDLSESLRKPVRSKAGKGLIGAAIGMAAPIALRAAQGYAMKFLENWILQQQMSLSVTGPLHVTPGPDPDSIPLRTPRRGGFSP